MIAKAARVGATKTAARLGGRTGAHAADDRQLARRASRGDVGAFGGLVHEHSGLVYGVALGILGARDAQDASQEVWIRVWRKIGGFRAESAFTTWLYRIAVNTCLDARRKEARWTNHRHEGEGPLTTALAGREADPEAAALVSERGGEITAALANLRADHRAALVLRHVEGLSYARIAGMLGVPEGTAKGWVSRARTAMLLALTKKSGSA